MALIEKLKKMATDKPIGHIMKNFAKTSASHPYLMARENAKFLSRCFFGATEHPKEGLRLEHHCHSNFSDGDELGDVIELLFANKISLCSLTDHNNFDAFDSLRYGIYKPKAKNDANKKYELAFSNDNRSMIIHSGKQQLVLLRSAEVLTNKGEIGIHGYGGRVPKIGTPFNDAIRQAIDYGAYAVINHPYHWSGIGFHGRGYIELAIQSGAAAIEKNGTEIPFQIYSPVKAELDAKYFDVPLVTAGDAHRLNMYGLSGLTFKEKDYELALANNSGNHADAIKCLIASSKFETYLNYLTPEEVSGFFPE